MLDQLTAEQAYELCAYHEIEPFGEVRDDLRMDHSLRLYFAGNGSKQIPCGALALYSDIHEAAQIEDSTKDLQSHMESLGAKRG